MSKMKFIFILALLLISVFADERKMFAHRDAGQFMRDLGQYKIFYRTYSCTSKDPCPTLLFLHGFPTSSYDYVNIADFFTDTHDVIMYDQLGFGLSDKPMGNFNYTMDRQARNLARVISWKVKDDAVLDIVSHDMGDTVLTEYLRLVAEGVVKEAKLGTVVFTNGGMVYDLISKRLGQMIITSRFGWAFVKYIPRAVRGIFSRMQLSTIWGNNMSTMEQDIEMISMLNFLKGGDNIIDKLSSYLIERSYGEEKWVDAVAKAVERGVKVWWVWGDSDAVAPKEIPVNFSRRVGEKMGGECFGKDGNVV